MGPSVRRWVRCPWGRLRGSPLLADGQWVSPDGSLEEVAWLGRACTQSREAET